MRGYIKQFIIQNTNCQHRNDPEVILADEPTGDLDEETEAEMMNFFKRMNEEKGMTFIMVTHSTELAKQTKQLRMSNGSIQDLRD